MATVLTLIGSLLLGVVESYLMAHGMNAAKPVPCIVGGVIAGLLGCIGLHALFAGPLAVEYALMGCVFACLLGVWITWSVTGHSAPAPEGDAGGHAASPQG